MGLSLHEQVKAKPKHEREAWVESLDEDALAELMRKPWWYIGRPEQQTPEGDWGIWLILSGRGWGKTRTGSETIVDWILTNPTAPDGAPTEWAVMGETFTDTRSICMDGPSGVVRALERRGLLNGEHFQYNKASWSVTFKTGQRIHMFGADNPDAGRGLNLSGLWADEVAKWRYSYESWHEGLAPALRIGERPRAIVTTTPKPVRLLKEWLNRTDGSVYVTRGATFDNERNLSRAALTELQARYAGTRIGRQELYGELLEDIEGALWSRKDIERARIKHDEIPTLARVVVAIDPAVTSGEDADETGIVVAGITTDSHYYVLADYTMRDRPDAWARRAVEAFNEYKADRIIGEANNGGDMIETLVRQVAPLVPYKKVQATRGKRLRAEPISAMYEQGRVHHVGEFPLLEEQMVSWTPDSSGSPDRLDALVWALTELSTGGVAMLSLAALAVFCPSCRLPARKSARVCSNCNTPLGE